MTVLLLYSVSGTELINFRPRCFIVLPQLLYIGGIVLLAIHMGSDTFDEEYNKLMEENDCSTGDHKDTWWCKFIQETKDNTST